MGGAPAMADVTAELNSEATTLCAAEVAIAADSDYSEATKKVIKNMVARALQAGMRGK